VEFLLSTVRQQPGMIFAVQSVRAQTKQKGQADVAWKMSKTSQPNRVLVIDDNRDAADSLAILLRFWGYEARAAYSGPEGLEAARAFRPSCILSDIGLPGMDGYHLAEALRQDESLSKTPLIALTAYAEPDKAKKAGFDEHFVKPADLLALQDLLKKFVIMDTRLEQAEEMVQKQGEVIAEAKDVMKEVKEDVKEIKEGLQEVKKDIKSVQEDVKQIKEDLRD
jgi:two-component system OmpR family response regulator